MTTEAEAVAKLAVDGIKTPSIVKHEERAWIFNPLNAQLTEVTDEHGMKRQMPVRIKARPRLGDQESFCAYVSKYKTDDTAVFCDYARSMFFAVIDYHAPNEAMFCDHTVVFQLTPSEESQRWGNVDKKLLPQEEFARFLEENIPDIVRPDGADLLEMARDLSARRTVNWRRAVRASNGDEEFEFNESTEAESRQGKGSVKVPTNLALKIPLFFNSEATELLAFLRWRLIDQKLLLGVELHRPVFVRQAVLKKIGAEIAEKTGTLVLVGNTAE